MDPVISTYEKFSYPSKLYDLAEYDYKIVMVIQENVDGPQTLVDPQAGRLVAKRYSQSGYTALKRNTLNITYDEDCELSVTAMNSCIIA